MLRLLLAAALLASPLFAATAARAQDMLSGSLIEALQAIEKPELGGVFTYVGTQNAPRAFADLIARDKKAMKRYTDKLMKDFKAAGGLTAWDHEVCATLVNHYAGGADMPGISRPDKKRLKALNDCVLSPVMELHDIVSRRNK
ncbi:MAG: hypothetical protein Q8T11_08450 [Elusimicrobiota bacterium]|nr:hypothetical protein [Elusimicrobiota bacterium]